MPGLNPTKTCQIQVCLQQALLAFLRYAAIVNEQLGHMASGSYIHPVADVGQSCGRGNVAVNGTIPCIVSSSRLYSFKLRRRLGYKC